MQRQREFRIRTDLLYSSSALGRNMPPNPWDRLLTFCVTFISSMYNPVHCNRPEARYYPLFFFFHRRQTISFQTAFATTREPGDILFLQLGRSDSAVSVSPVHSNQMWRHFTGVHFYTFLPDCPVWIFYKHCADGHQRQLSGVLCPYRRISRQKRTLRTQQVQWEGSSQCVASGPWISSFISNGVSSEWKQNRGG